MPKFYFSFGQSHAHANNAGTLDKDCLAEIEAVDSMAARAKAFELWGRVWSMQYDNLTPEILSYFPRGVIKVV